MHGAACVIFQTGLGCPKAHKTEICFFQVWMTTFNHHMYRTLALQSHLEQPVWPDPLCLDLYVKTRCNLFKKCIEYINKVYYYYYSVWMKIQPSIPSHHVYLRHVIKLSQTAYTAHVAISQCCELIAALIVNPNKMSLMNSLEHILRQITRGQQQSVSAKC